MSDREKEYPPIDVVWPTLLTIALGIYGYLKFTPELKSLRPREVSQPLSESAGGKEAAERASGE